ncbi:stage III sporulation protein AD [Metallumcola ferriviriculae]|uniref:Stage III sporulation protein AD n=1 Tax=Metallumcola ferriviriculae TaxID=3039180 RepID=A0AAU0URT3_9FIRM|nr:stage III sporulation protein AD [Desulfitibacteraceae bacterium MK1]
MEIFQIVGFGLITVVLIVLVKQLDGAHLGALIRVVFGAVVFLLLLGKIANILDIVQELFLRANVNQFYLGTILKVIGIAYIAEFGAQVCRDAGESAIAQKVEFAGKILVLVLALPILAAIVETVIKLLP